VSDSAWTCQRTHRRRVELKTRALQHKKCLGVSSDHLIETGSDERFPRDTMLPAKGTHGAVGFNQRTFRRSINLVTGSLFGHDRQYGGATLRSCRREEGRDRLRVLSRIFAPPTTALLDRIEIVPGMRCVDIGCGGGDVSVELARRVGPGGAVTAIGFDAEALAIARREAVQAGFQNLSYRHLDLFALILDEPVDVVFTRFVLTHLQDPAAALRKMAGLLRPGGRIVVEDADASANFCYPPESAFDLYCELYRETMRARGSDPDIGPKLPHLLRNAGFGDIGLNVCQPAEFIGGDVKLLVALTLDSVAQPALEAGLTISDKVNAASKRLHELVKDDHTVMSMPRIVQAWGRLL
jgi:SAM-dependent methyltransferase